VALMPRTRAGLTKFRPVRPGSRVALVAPASGFDRDEFDRGVTELKRLGLEPVYDESVFDKQALTAGRPRVRVMALLRAFDEMDADAVIAVRGGYGSVELLPLLDVERIRRSRTAFVGYSDVTSLHSFLGAIVGLASVHGAMVDGRLAQGPKAYDPASFLRPRDAAAWHRGRAACRRHAHAAAGLVRNALRLQAAGRPRAVSRRGRRAPLPNSSHAHAAAAERPDGSRLRDRLRAASEMRRAGRKGHGARYRPGRCDRVSWSSGVRFSVRSHHHADGEPAARRPDARNRVSGFTTARVRRGRGE
jgi:hypothetical protein